MTKAAADRAGESAFSTRTVVALLIAGVFAFSALTVLSAYAPDLRGGSDGGAHALSRSAVGFAGAARLFEAMGDPVVISRDPHVRTSSTGLLILTPGLEADQNDLFDMTSVGPTLVVLPKWATTPDPATAGWALKAGVYPTDSVATLLERRFAGIRITRDAGTAAVRLTGLPGGPLSAGPIDQLQTLSGGGDLVAIMRDARGRTLLAASRSSRVFVLSDPDVLNTQGLKDLATAKVAVSLVNALRKSDGPIIFDVTLNGFARSRNLLRLAFDPPFLGATTCVAGAALLMALQALARFGAPRRAGRAIALGKRALADNSAALIKLARREPRMAGRYLDLTRAYVAKALGVGRLDDVALDALLDRRAERANLSQRLRALSAQAASVKDRAGLMRLADALNQWKTEMISGRR